MISCFLILFSFLLLNSNDASVTRQNYFSNQTFDDAFIDFIAYGRDYDKNKHPYVVSILIADKYQCTGSLLKPTFVLTAAHCTWRHKADDIVVIHGAIGLYVHSKPKDYGDIQREGINIWQHEEYHNTYNDWPDIAIVEISRPFDCPFYIEIGGNPNEFRMNKALDCIGIGFGNIETQQPPWLVGKEYNCRVKHGPRACPRYTDRKIWKMYLCIQQGKEQICSGDSGGPTICNGKQYGITKAVYGLNNKPDYECGDPVAITMHVFVHFFRDWISAIVGPLKSGGGGEGGGGGIGEQEEGHEENGEHDGEHEYDSEQEYDEEYASENTGSTITKSTHNYFLLKITLCILVLKCSV